MKAADIEPGREYLANTSGTGRYGTKGKARVLRIAEPADLRAITRDQDAALRAARRSQRSGAKLWFVEWLAPYRSSRFDHLPLGEQTVVPSSYIERLWTDEDESKVAQELAWEQEADALEKRLRAVVELEGHPVRVTGQKTASPSYTLTRLAVERLLKKVGG